MYNLMLEMSVSTNHHTTSRRQRFRNANELKILYYLARVKSPSVRCLLTNPRRSTYIQTSPMSFGHVASNEHLRPSYEKQASV